GPADQLVESVVPPHVLADGEEVPLRVEQGRRVEAAGGGEHSRALAQARRQGRDDLRRDLRPGRDRLRHAELQGFEPRLAADAAGAGGEEVALQTGELRGRD